MAQFYSSTEDATITGTNWTDSISTDGARTYVDGGRGEDTINPNGFLTTVHGGADNDKIHVLNSYIVAYGDDGNDYFLIRTYDNYRNVANITLVGGEGADEFDFRPYDHNIYGATIEDFTPGEDSFWLYADVNEPLRRYITYDFDDNGDIVIHNANGTANITLKDIKDFSEIADVTLGYRDYNGNLEGSTTFARAVSGDNTLINVVGRSSMILDIFASVVGSESSDWIYGGGYLSTVHGGGGNDSIYAISGKVDLYGEAGNDVLIAQAASAYLTDISMTGGTGRDRFSFNINTGSVNSLVITDFNVDDGDYVAFFYDYITTRHLLRSTNGDGDLVFKTSDGMIDFTMKDIKNFSDIANSTISCYTYLGSTLLETKTFEEMLVPYGMVKTVTSGGQTSAYISSLAGEDVWLGGWDFFNNKLSWEDDSIVVIDARDALIGGMLAGNSNDNLIYASDYGNQLWGGLGDNTLVGGAGIDSFWAGVGGTVHVENCSATDHIFLWNVNANDIQSSNAGFNGDSDGVTLNVGGENIMTVRRANNASTTTVQLLDGTRWSYDYSSGSAQLMTVPRGLIVSGRTVSVTSAFEGNLWLGGVDQNGDAVWGSDYLMNIDAYEDDGIRFLVGNAENNSIRAGHNGSTLWGGSSGYDILRGGDGNDVFYAGKGEYYTRVANYNSNDLIYLWNANFSDLKNMAVQSDYFFKSIGILFNDGSTVEASSSFEETTTFKFADGSFMRYDPSTNTWQRNTDGTWQTFSELDNAPIGVLALDDTAMIYSDHVGAFALVDLNDSSVTRVNATNDTISGRILIGDEQNNRIYANDYGNQLWGGNGGSDTLTGGSGADTFIAGLGEGNVSISNYASNDLVYLWNADRYDIKSMVVQNRTNRREREVRLTTVEDDTIKTVSRLDEETISFQLADGFTFRYVVADNAWQSYDSSTDEWQVFTSINGMPVGLELEYDYNAANIYTDYVGNFSLSEFNDSLITDIWAYDEVSGRVLIGDEQSNYINAGGGGVSMWGGNGGDDILYGGSGDDTFVAGQGEGDVDIIDCSSSDLVFLHNINFSDLKYLRLWVGSSSRSVDLMTEDDSVIEVYSNLDEATTNFQFADGSLMRYSATDNAWQRSTDGSTWSTFTLVNGTPVGVQVYDDTAQVYSDYVGAFSLSSINDSLVTDINATNDTVSGRVLIGDAQDNEIDANNYGSSLWGGNGGDDTLYGGSGADTFVAGQGEGDVDIRSYSSDDLVYLHNINFSDLKYLRVYVGNSSRAVDAVSEDGTFIAVWSDFDEETTNYQFADGSLMRYSATDNAWQRSTDGSTWSTFTSVNGTPVGVQVYDDTAQVYSDFVGVFDLNDLNDSLVTGISAYNDTLSGRVLIGDAQDNWIRANDYGSSLWGGNGGDDTLRGGGGDDTFVAGQGEGDVDIRSYSSDDLVYLHNINFSDLKYLRLWVGSSSRSVDLMTEDDSVIEVYSNLDEATTNFQFADGSLMRYSATDNAWQRSTDGSTWSTFTSVNGTPVGVWVNDTTARVYSDHVGSFALSDLNDSLVTDINATNDTVSGRVLIGDAQDNSIRANDYGSSLWGGTDGYDYLYGGAGADTFVAGADEGNTDIIGCADNDLVLLWNVDLNEMTVDLSSSDSGVNIALDNSSTINIARAEDTSTTTIQFSNGSKRQYNYSDQTWSTKY